MFYEEPAAKRSVKGEYDVVVLGGGPAGIGAAFAAARMGMRTLVVEQHNCLGGVGTAGGHGYMCLCNDWRGARQIVGGIAWEVLERIAKAGHGDLWIGNAFYDVEAMKLQLDRMARECGLDVLYHTFFCESIVKDGQVVGAVIQNKGGRQAVYAKRVIDCTGDGDAAYTAGCAYEMGRPGDGKCQPVTLMFTIGGVDMERVRAWRKTDGKHDYAMKRVWLEAQENGDMRPFQDHIMGWWWNSTQPTLVGCNFTHVTDVDITKAEDLTAATMEAREQAYECLPVYRKYVDGMQDCYLISTAATIGLRESRRILGEHLLTEQEIMAETRFPDNICNGSFFIDIHSLDGPGMAATTWRPHEGFFYNIPYRSIVPQEIDNILVAGRCISVTHVGLGSARVMSQCTGTGEAAGTAAALSIQQGTTPRALPVELLQETLRKHGGIIRDEDVRPFPETLKPQVI